MRLDLFLSAREPALSRSFLQKLCAKGNVFVSGQQQFKSGYRVRENQKVEVWIPPPEIIAAQPEDLPLEIIYEDKELLVVNKPKGWWFIPPRSSQSALVNALLPTAMFSLPWVIVSGRALFTGWTRIQADCWWWQK